MTENLETLLHGTNNSLYANTNIKEN